MTISRNSAVVRQELSAAISEMHRYQTISRMGAMTNVESRLFQEVSERVGKLYAELRIASNINKGTPGLLPRLEAAKDAKVLRQAQQVL